MQRLKIAIAGYGIAGIAAAIFLRRQGHDITHFEQAEKLGFQGSGLLLQPSGLAVLRQLELLDAAMARGTPVIRLVAQSDAGRTIMDLGDDRGCGLGIQRGALFGLLYGKDAQAEAVRTGWRIADADPDTGYLTGDDGTKAGPFDLIVAADGANSRLRAVCAPLVRQDRPYRWGARLALLDDPFHQFPGKVMQFFSGAHHVSLWPVGTLRPGEPHRINLSWRMIMPASNAVSDKELENWKRAVAALCPPLAPLLEQISGADQVMTADYRDVRLARYYRGRLVFLGDAAHSMSPQLGQGASMALLDACALAQALERHSVIREALCAFDKKRRTAMRFVQLASAAMTPFFQSDSPLLAAIRDHAFHPLSRMPFMGRTILATLGGRHHLAHAGLPD